MKPKPPPRRGFEGHYSEEERHRAKWLFGSAAIFVALMILIAILVYINK